MHAMIPSLARFCSLCLGLSLLLAGTIQAATFSTVEERMSAAQFKTAGLDKLSAEELAALNAWLQGNAAPAAAPGYAAPADMVGFRQQDATGVVVSRIIGPFNGWDGKTKFTLENGQIWEQVEQGSLRGVNLDSPMVTIEPGMFGSWRIKVEGLNATTRVNRIK
jgi:hypothetical protein